MNLYGFPPAQLDPGEAVVWRDVVLDDRGVVKVTPDSRFTEEESERRFAEAREKLRFSRPSRFRGAER